MGEAKLGPLDPTSFQHLGAHKTTIGPGPWPHNSSSGSACTVVSGGMLGAQM